MEEHIEKFLEYIGSQRNFSESTIVSYKKDLMDFLEFLRNEYPAGQLKPENVDRLSVRNFLAYLKRRGLKKNSVLRKLSSLKSFFGYLCREGLIGHNPASGVSSPRRERRLPSFLDTIQAEKLMNVPSGNDVLGLRDRAILEVLYGTGIRLGELVSMDLSSLDPVGQTIKVFGKGRKQRIIPLGRGAMKALDKYLLKRRELLQRKTVTSKDNNALFLNNLGGRLTARSVERIVSGYMSKVSEAEGLSPHTLRHTFATHMLGAGADLEAVKEFLGHSSLSTTQVYTHLTVEKLRKIYNQAHPRA